MKLSIEIDNGDHDDQSNNNKNADDYDETNDLFVSVCQSIGNGMS